MYPQIDDIENNDRDTMQGRGLVFEPLLQNWSPLGEEGPPTTEFSPTKVRHKPEVRLVSTHVVHSVALSAAADMCVADLRAITANSTMLLRVTVPTALIPPLVLTPLDRLVVGTTMHVEVYSVVKTVHWKKFSHAGGRRGAAMFDVEELQVRRM